MSRQILVSNALPYANGPLHLGHMVGYVQADIWVRFQRMCGNPTTYVCADDAHGTPIMLAAEKAGVTPEAFIQRYGYGAVWCQISRPKAVSMMCNRVHMKGTSPIATEPATFGLAPNATVVMPSPRAIAIAATISGASRR